MDNSSEPSKQSHRHDHTSRQHGHGKKIACARCTAIQQELEQRADEYLQGWKRAQADYQNLQKQLSAERDSMRHVNKLAILMQILPLYNHFELAMNHTPKNAGGAGADNSASVSEIEHWVQGISHIKDQFSNILKELGVARIDAEPGSLFDPQVHEAMSKESNDHAQSGTIVREISPGYRIDGDVVIPSKVIVAE